MAKYNKEQKAEYFKQLREQWKKAKEISALEGKEIEAIIMTHGLNISITGFQVVITQMKEQGLDGLPYLDAKTYKGWKESGYQVKRGQSSTLSGITWIGTKGKEAAENGGEDKKGFTFPKCYHLFHRSQVEAA